MIEYKEEIFEHSEELVLKSKNVETPNEYSIIDLSMVKEGGVMIEVEIGGYNHEGYGIDNFSFSMSEDQMKALHSFLSKQLQK